MIFENLIFIHIPKTAGSSIQNSLNNNYKLLYEGTNSFFEHISADDNMTLGGKKIKAKSFKRHLPLELIQLSKYYDSKPIITFVRNPFSRAVSLYYECIRSSFYREELRLSQNSDFNNFLSTIKDNEYWFTLPMIDWIGEKNINKLNYIGKFETIDRDIDQINKKLKTNIKLKHHNYNNSIGTKYSPANYTYHYKKDNIIYKVEKIFQKDLDKFSYNFDNFKSFEKKKVSKYFIISNSIKRKIQSLF